MLAQMSYEQFMEWREFSLLDPIDDARMDAGFAMLASVLVNINRGPNSKAAKITDFMLFSRTPEELDKQMSGRSKQMSSEKWQQVKEGFKQGRSEVKSDG